MNIPAAMENASAFEVYVWVHQCDRTFEQIRKRWNKSHDEIRAAIDKGIRLGWQDIPRNELPYMPDPEQPKPPRYISNTSVRDEKKAITAAKHKHIYEDFMAGLSRKQLSEKYGMTPKSISGVVREQARKARTAILAERG